MFDSSQWDTDEDIDKYFSRTSMPLLKNNAVTLHDLHDGVRDTVDSVSIVGHMKKIINWSGFCDAEWFLIKW